MVVSGCGKQNEAGNSASKPEENKINFPEKRIQLIVPFAAGGGTDAVARALASTTEKYLEKPIVIINKAGGSGAVGMTEGSKAKPDGYTVTMITREIVSLPLMDLCSVTTDDFDLLANINLDPALITVKPDSKYQNISELIEDSKKNPTKIKFASPAKPNLYILAIELAEKVKFNHIPYNGAAEAIPAIMGGHADFTITSPGEVISQINSGQLRPLAVMADEQLASLPDVPTMKEEGFDVTSGTWRGLAVPKGTPQEVKDILAKAFKQDKQFIDFMNNANLGIHYLDADGFRSFIEEDTVMVSKIVEAVEKQQ